MKNPIIVILIFSSVCFSNAFGQTVTIPDTLFKNYLLNNPTINSNSDTEIQVTEAISYNGGIDIIGLGISDLTGIEMFTQINILQAQLNNISTADLSTNLLLTYISLQANNLTSLTLGNNINLWKLYCHNNLLTNLNVSGNTNLELIRCFSNNIDSLDLSNNTLLYDIYSHHNSLIYLNLANNNYASYLTFNTNNNPNLNCIIVDDVPFMENNFSALMNKDSTATYSTDCSNTNSILKNDLFSYSIYPNPTEDVVTFAFETTRPKLTINLYNTVGKVIKSYTTTNKDKIVLELNGLNSGMYFYKIIALDNQYSLGKIVKK